MYPKLARLSATSMVLSVFVSTAGHSQTLAEATEPLPIVQSYRSESARNGAMAVSHVRFVSPAGMKIGWQAGNQFADGQLTAPARYDFRREATYRLKLTSIPNRKGVVLYPTLQVYPAAPATKDYLDHMTLKIDLSGEECDFVEGGKYLVKVLYLPDTKFRERVGPDIDGATPSISTVSLDPGVDPISEADQRGTILCVLRLGNIDVEMSTRRRRNRDADSYVQLRFTGPEGMQIGWMMKDRTFANNQVSVPGRVDFVMGKDYQLKFSEIAGRRGLRLYPRLSFAKVTRTTEEYISHAALSFSLTEEELNWVEGRRMLRKVLYLPDPKFAELEAAKVSSLASASGTLSTVMLDRGIDVVAESDRRGTIFCVLTFGTVDLEKPKE